MQLRVRRMPCRSTADLLGGRAVREIASLAAVLAGAPAGPVGETLAAAAQHRAALFVRLPYALS